MQCAPMKTYCSCQDYNHTSWPKGILKSSKYYASEKRLNETLPNETDDKIGRLPIEDHRIYTYYNLTYRNWFISWDESLHAATHWVSIFVNLK